MSKAFLEKQDWREIVTKANHYVAIGQRRVYLFSDDDHDGLWEFVTKVESGATHRLDISTSVNFTAEHPSGLNFEWSIDIEDRDANGLGYYKVALERLRAIMLRLPLKARQQFSDYLESCANAVEKNSEQYREIWEREQIMAECLRKAMAQA